jgi:AraC-like DNA-binding protein
LTISTRPHNQSSSTAGRKIILHLGDPFELVRDDSAIERQPRTIFAGRLPARPSAPLAHELRDACDSQPTLAHAVHPMRECLQRHLHESQIDGHVRAAIGAIRRQYGIGSVDEIAALTGVSPRHLERRFQEVVGLSPKRLARVRRFQRALRFFERGVSGNRGAATAAACGYADQAHFIRDFGELAGCSPEAHLLRDAMLSRLFAGPARPDPT